MINCNPMRSLCNYGSSALYKDPPSEEQIRNGVIPLDSLPAAWWNWMWSQTNGAVIEAKSAMSSVISEINNVLAAANITPQSACLDQLFRSIDCIRQTLATSTVPGAVVSSSTSGKVSVDADGVMTANGLGNVSSLTTVTKTTVVGAINELKDDYETCVATLGNAIDGLNNTKAPNDHSSTSTLYGLGNTTKYGHVKLSDTYAEAVGGVSEGVAASQKAVNDMYTAITGAGFVTLGNIAGCALGTASAGSASTAARSDHVHPYAGRLVDGTEAVVAEGGNELNIYPATGDHAWINYRGGASTLIVGNGAAGQGVVCASVFCGTASYATSAGSTSYAASAGYAGNAGAVAGYGVSAAATGNSIALRQGNGYLFATYFNASNGVEDNLNIARIFYDTGDGYLRKCSINKLKELLMQEVVITGTDWADLSSKIWIPTYSSGSTDINKIGINAYGKINGRAFAGGLYVGGNHLYMSPQKGNNTSGIDYQTIAIQLFGITSFEIHLVP